MPGWLIDLNWLTFLWLVGWAVWALLNISSNHHRSISFLLLVFFVLYGIPIILDLTRGVPEHFRTPGFRAGATAESVALFYDLFVAACPVFWWLTTRSHPRSGRHVVISAGKRARALPLPETRRHSLGKSYPPAPFPFCQPPLSNSSPFPSGEGGPRGIGS